MPARRLDLRKLTLAVAALATLATVGSCGTPIASAGGKPGESSCPPTFPAVALPAIVPWNGAPLPTGPHSVIVVQKHVQYPGDYVAYQVEWTVPSIPNAVWIPAGKLSQFTNLELLATIAINRPLPPPPPVVDVPRLLQESWMVEHQ